MHLNSGHDGVTKTE